MPRSLIRPSRNLFALVILLAALAGATLQPAAASSGPAQAPTHIVVLAPGASASAVATAHGVGIARAYTSALTGFAAVVPEGRLEALARDRRVASVEPNAVFSVGAPAAATQAVGTASSQLIPAGITRTGAAGNPIAPVDGVDDRVNVVVAVLDTGVDAAHPDLNVNVARSADCSLLAGACIVGVAGDDNGHGTHVAGTIGALDNTFGVVGMAPGAEIWSVRVCDASGSCRLDSIIAAHDYVSANAGTIAVANMSLGGLGWSEAWRTAIVSNVNTGVVVVVAAGNSQRDIYGYDGAIANGNEYIPSSFPETMAVSAMVDLEGAPGGLAGSHPYGADDSMASFSNFALSPAVSAPVTSTGGPIDVAAPGVNVLSTYPGGQYAIMNGTSMASPHAAGLVALYVATHGRATNAAGVAGVRQAIIDGASPMSGWRADTVDTDSDRDTQHEGLISIAALGQIPADPPPAPEEPAPQTGNVALVGIGAPSGVETGTPVSVSVSIRNEAAFAQELTVDLRDATENAAIGRHTTTVGAGAQVSVVFTWTPQGTVGGHTLEASVSAPVDDDAEDNTAAVVVQVSEPAPAPEPVLTLGPGKPAYTNGEWVVLTAHLSAGDDPVAGATVRVVITTPSGKERSWDDVTSAAGVASVSYKANAKRDGCGVFTAVATLVSTANAGVSATTTFEGC